VNGIHDLPEAEYFAQTHALSASGAKLLLPPNCPALFRWAQDHPVHKDVFDFGSAAHRVVLGAGPRIDIIDAPDWRTARAKQQRDEARAAGFTPLLIADWAQVTAMADAIRAHPLASVLFDPSAGRPELSMFWDDPETGVPCRARPDWLPDPRGGRLTIPDYKTTVSAHPDDFAKSVGNYGYHIQHAHYTAGAAALGLGDDPAFVFVAQEKTPPYLVNVVQLDDGAIQAGKVAMRAAIELFASCTATDTWPGYPMDIPEISLPPWAARIPEGFYS
jgi:hypothetical protein